MKTKGILETLKTPELTGDLLADQLAWETHGIELGAEKVRRDLKHAERRGGFETRADAQRIIKGALPLVASRVTIWLLENERPAGAKGGRVHGALSSLKLVDPDELALIALSSVFNGVAPRPKPIQSVAVQAGRQVEIALEAHPRDRRVVLRERQAAWRN